MSDQEKPYWKTKTLEQMSGPEWEALCDGCARCCLVKLQDEESDALYFTDIGCRLLDGEACKCRDYENRSQRVPDCVRLDAKAVRTLPWLPPTCAYRLVAEGRDLYWWHHLVSGDRATVHEAGVSVRGRVGPNEDDIALDDYEDRIVTWPARLPKAARGKLRKS